MQAYAAQEKLDLIAVSETAIKHTISDDKIEIDGYSVIRNDLRNNERCGGVLLYHKNDLSVKKQARPPNS